MPRHTARPACLRAALPVAAALATALLLPVRPAAAQVFNHTDPRVYAYTQTWNLQTNESWTDWTDKRGYMTGAALNDQYGNEAGAFVDSEEFTVRARAFGSATSPGAARAVAYFATDIRFLNASLGTKAQPFEAFFHGLLQRTHGTRSGMGSADMWFRVKDGDGVLVMEMTQRHSGTSRTTPESGTDVARPLQKSLDLGVGYSRFLIELGVETNVQGAYEAEFGNTVNLFIPSVEGVTWEAPPGVGSRQFVPAWARADAPTTTTPEPASLALVAGGALALVVVRRRVRTA